MTLDDFPRTQTNAAFRIPHPNPPVLMVCTWSGNLLVGKGNRDRTSAFLCSFFLTARVLLIRGSVFGKRPIITGTYHPSPRSKQGCFEDLILGSIKCHVTSHADVLRLNLLGL